MVVTILLHLFGKYIIKIQKCWQILFLKILCDRLHCINRWIYSQNMDSRFGIRVFNWENTVCYHWGSSKGLYIYHVDMKESWYGTTLLSLWTPQTQWITRYNHTRNLTLDYYCGNFFFFFSVLFPEKTYDEKKHIWMLVIKGSWCEKLLFHISIWGQQGNLLSFSILKDGASWEWNGTLYFKV